VVTESIDARGPGNSPLIATSVRRRRGIAVASVLIGVAAADPVAQQSLSLVPVADIPLGGNTTRLDYESLDPGRHLLFIAHLGDSAGNRQNCSEFVMYFWKTQ
jgi:hypothetical protein